MPNYRRALHEGGIYFFTVNLLQRKDNDLLVRHINHLRDAIKQVRQKYPFKIHAFVVLPDHLHCVIELPLGDSNFAIRWRRIKSIFSKSIPRFEDLSITRLQRGERGIWQRRFWEHLIRDEDDYNAHIDYIHINPLKHGLVNRLCDWPYSTFHALVERGVYPKYWAGGEEEVIEYVD
jgi:putative transposase